MQHKVCIILLIVIREVFKAEAVQRDSVPILILHIWFKKTSIHTSSLIPHYPITVNHVFLKSSFPNP